MKKRKSIHDIARELRLSATTISYVLNGKAEEKRIKRESVKKIEDYIKKIGYQPNLVARSLRTGKSMIIAVLVEDISDPFFSGITRVVEEEAYQSGYKIFNASTNNDPERTRALIATFRDLQVDGYLIAPSPGIEQEIQHLMNDHFPVVLFDRYFLSLETHNVVIDNFKGAYQAVLHFIENGYRTIGLATLESDQIQMTDRLAGYAKAMDEHGLGVHIEKFHYGMSTEEVMKKMRAFLQTDPGLDAILFATNYLTVDGLKTMGALNLGVPDDMAVIAFDDNTHFSLFKPHITAVAQPVREISRQAVRLLMECLAEGEEGLEKRTIVLQPKLIIRDSAKQKAAIDPLLISKPKF